MDMSLNKLQEPVMDRETWRATVYGVTKSQTWPRDWTDWVIMEVIQKNWLKDVGTFLAVQWLKLHTSNAGGTGSIPGWGTKISYAMQQGKKKKRLTVLTYVFQSFIHVRPHGLQHSRLPCSSLSPSLLKFMSSELVMLSNHLILFCPLLLLPSIFPKIRVFSNESYSHMQRIK